MNKELETISGNADSDDYIRDMKLNTIISKLLEEIMNISWSEENQAGD